MLINGGLRLRRICYGFDAKIEQEDRVVHKICMLRRTINNGDLGHGQKI